MQIGGKTFDTGHRTYIMGILNVTPDSFSDGGRFQDLDAALRHGEEMLQNGADLLDVGGESTRPGYVRITEEEEIRRVVPVIRRLKQEFDVPVSVDTYKSQVARAALENGLLGDALPLKVSYDITCFRYEKPGSGRFREFHQFGVELYGAASPAADSEVLALAYECLTVLGLQNVVLELNSLGCPECRKKYTQALLAYFESHRERLCATCLERLEKNPLRVLDCKNPEDQKIAAGAPSILDYLCGDCQNHFQEVQDRLTAAEIPFRVEPTIVRGLDYYTRTVFEMVHTAPDGERLVCGGGGRYGGLIQELGKDTIVLLSTHIVSDVEKTAGHMLMMCEGRIILNEPWDKGRGDLEQLYMEEFGGEAE